MIEISKSELQELQQQVVNLKLLESAALRLNSTLNLSDLLKTIVEEVANAFGCSRSAVLLFTPAGDELELVAMRGWTESIHPKGHRFTTGGEGLLGRVAATGETYYAPDVRLERTYIVSEPSTRTELDIPLKVKEQFIGVFNAQHPVVDAFSATRREMLEALASHISIAIENARLFEKEQARNDALLREYSQAQSMQRRLLPQLPLPVGEFILEGRCEPIRAVGGDWFDYFELPGGKVGFVLGDVSGKGISAALLMASVRSSLRQQASALICPGQVLTKLNRILLNDFPEGNFVTLIYGVVDPLAGTIALVNAGHPAPIGVKSKSAESLEVARGLPLGMFEGQYEETEIHLDAGDTLVLYSDGIEEARSCEGEEFGADGIKAALRIGSLTAHTLIDRVLAFRAADELLDDATALAIHCLDI